VRVSVGQTWEPSNVAESWIRRENSQFETHSRPELFLGLPGNQYGQDWSVYKLRGDGTCSPLGPIRFHYEAFYYDLAERRLWAAVRATAATGGWTQFRLTRSGFVEDTNPGKRDLAVDMARARSWHRPPVGWAVVANLLAGKEGVARPAEPEERSHASGVGDVGCQMSGLPNRGCTRQRPRSRRADWKGRERRCG
jgi:hypothetical protein